VRGSVRYALCSTMHVRRYGCAYVGISSSKHLTTKQPWALATPCEGGLAGQRSTTSLCPSHSVQHVSQVSSYYIVLSKGCVNTAECFPSDIREHGIGVGTNAKLCPQIAICTFPKESLTSFLIQNMPHTLPSLIAAPKNCTTLNLK
jgi:hypothetical protein